MFEILANQQIKRLFVIAVLIRLLIMPFYLHPDIKTYNFQSSFLKKGIFNIYDYLQVHKGELPLKDEFVYFPLTYYFLGAYQFIATPFLGSGFDEWLADAGSTSSEKIGVFRYLFILKLPYLVLDLLIGLILVSLFSDFVSKKKVLTFWLLNPFSIILLYVYSNVDIFPVFLIVLSLYLYKKNILSLSALALGLGGAFKAFPILLVPFLLSKTPKLKSKITVLLFSVIVFGLIILPFLSSTSFRQSTLVSGLTTRIVSSGISIGFDQLLMPAIVLLSVLLFWSWGKLRVDLWRLYAVAFIFILTTIHFHIHWLLWLMPFFAMLYASDNDDAKLVVPFLTIAFVIPLLYSDKFMTVGLLKVISTLFELLPTPSTVLTRVYNPSTLLGILQSMLFGLGIVLSFRILKK